MFSYPLEHAWRSSLATVSDQHARKSMGLTNENDLRMFGQEQQERWHCYKKELYPGCALPLEATNTHDMMTNTPPLFF